MKKIKSMKVVASALAMAMLIGGLIGCGNTAASTAPTSTTAKAEESTAKAEESTAKAEETTTAKPEVTERVKTNGEMPFVYATDILSEKFSKFFEDTAYDRDVADMTAVSLLINDRAGGLIMNAIEGEDHEYNGVNYNYKGIANITITQDEAADQTKYNFKIRDDVKFSDGEALTADDIIFSYYVYLDPSYNGSATISSINILGKRDYQTQTSEAVYAKYDKMYDAIFAAGEDHKWADGDAWTAEQQTWYWENLKKAWMDDVQAIVNLVNSKYASEAKDTIGYSSEDVAKDEGLKIAFGMALYGYGEVKDGVLTSKSGKTYNLKDKKYPTLEDFYKETHEAYKGDPVAYWEAEQPDKTSVDSVARLAFIKEWGPKDTEMAGKGVPNISGIKKLSATEVEITTEGFDAAAVYQLGIAVSPLHYYGDKAQYNYEENKFGHPYGDLALVEAKTTKPMGAGPYKFIKFENKTVFFEANENYFKGAPKIKYVQFKESNEADKISGVVTGAADISNPSFNDNAIKEVKAANSNKELSGDTLETVTVNNLGYGYIGINAATVKVGDDAASDASKNLRRAFATIFAVYRDFTVNSYYGERANVINYPISDTSWAAPQPTDEGYRIAFSTAVDGSDLYTADMSADDKYAKAVAAAVEYLKAAGYTYDEASKKFTAAPEGAKLEYEAIIPAGGKGDHPNFKLFDSASTALKSIGINLIINDPSNSNVLWDKLNAGTQEIWSAAWAATIDPDMYQIYYSKNIVGEPGSTESNHYHIQDPQLDSLILEARTSGDQAFRKATYKAALDVIIDWAVEIPVYQRQNCFVFSAKRLDLKTLTPDITTFWGWMNDIEKLEMK